MLRGAVRLVCLVIAKGTHIYVRVWVQVRATIIIYQSQPNLGIIFLFLNLNTLAIVTNIFNIKEELMLRTRVNLYVTRSEERPTAAPAVPLPS